MRFRKTEIILKVLLSRHFYGLMLLMEISFDTIFEMLVNFWRSCLGILT